MRVAKYMAENNITDKKKRRDITYEKMAEFARMCHNGDRAILLPNSNAQMCSCLKCQQPGKKVVGRGLCNSCFKYYSRLVSKSEGKVTWPMLEEDGKCLPPRFKKQSYVI